MAFLLHEEDEDQQQEGESGPDGKVISSNEGGAISGGGMQAATASGGVTKPQQPSKSGVYTNLNAYVSANKGNDATMGDRVKQTVDTTANKASQAGEQFKQTGTQAVQQGTVKTNDQIIQNLKNDPRQVDKQQFQTQYNAQYAGPKQAQEVQGYGDTQQGFKKVEGQAKAAQGGIAEKGTLLTDTYQAPNYSRGERNLDSYILGTGKQGQQKLQEIGQQYNNYGQNLANIEQYLSGQMQQGQQETDATRKLTQDTFGQSRAGYEGQIADWQKKMENTNASNTAAWDTLNSQLHSADPLQRAKAWQSLGLSPEQGEFLKGQGYDNRRMVTKGGLTSLGDYADPTKTAQYQGLLALIDEQAKQDFSKSGTSGKAFDIDANQHTAGQDYYSLDKDLTQRMTDTNVKRQMDYRNLDSDIASYLDAVVQPDTSQLTHSGNPFSTSLWAGFNATAPTGRKIAERLGFKPDEWEIVDFAVRQGIDPREFLSANRTVDYGDIATDDDRRKMTDLVGKLGLAKGRNLTDLGDERGAYDFKITDFLNKLKPIARPGEAVATSGLDAAGATVGNRNVYELIKRYLGE